jgi:osmotically-inducible protein OsmY
MAQDRDYRHWDEDWRGRRAQAEGENQRGRDGGYSSGHIESGFGDRGPNRYGGREEWRASSFGPRNYGSQEDSSWRGRDEDRWSRGRGGGEREHSGWGERTGRGEHGGSGRDWPERDRWRDREQSQYTSSGPRYQSSGGGSLAGGYGYGGRSGSYGERSYGQHNDDDRGFWDRASDEVQSWFGDEDARNRRERDYEQDHRGRGPRGYTRSDERIREDVCDRLSQDRRVDASDIDVKVSSGEVNLTGQVDSRMARRRAEDCAETISGVRHVQNNLRVQEYSGAMGSGAATSSSIDSGSRATGTTTGSQSAGSGAQGGAAGQKPGS